MKTSILTTTVVTILFLAGCGGGSSSSSHSVDEIPADINIDNIDLIAGERTALIVTVPKPEDPYTKITIDIGRTLQNANITVTPQ